MHAVIQKFSAMTGNIDLAKSIIEGQFRSDPIDSWRMGQAEPGDWPNFQLISS
jgi:hypothetical protein